MAVADDVRRIETVLADASAALAEGRSVDLTELNGMVEELCEKVRETPDGATPETVESLSRLIGKLDALAGEITKRRDALGPRGPGGGT